MGYAGKSTFRERQRTRGEVPPPGPAQQTDYGSSPAVARALDSIGDSPLAVAQRQTIGRLFGAPAQRQEEEESLQAKPSAVQRVEEEEPIQGRWAVQRAGGEEEEPMQGRWAAAAQREAMDEELPGQAMAAAQRVEEEEPIQGRWAVQRAGSEEEEPMQGRWAAAAQREAMDEELPGQAMAAAQRVEEEEPIQGRWAVQRAGGEEEEPLQGMMADALQRKVSMKDGGAARRTTGSGPTLTKEVDDTIASGDLDDMQSTENQLRMSIANRETDLYARKDKGSEIYQSHLARIQLEQELKKKLDAEIKKLKPAPKPAKPAKKKAAPPASSNPFAALDMQ